MGRPYLYLTGLFLIGSLTGCGSPAAAPTPSASQATSVAPPLRLPVSDESGVVPVSHQVSTGGVDEGEVRLVMMFVEFQSDPLVDALLNQLWPDSETEKGNTLTKSNVIDRKELLDSLYSLQNQGLARMRPEQVKHVADTQSHSWAAPLVPPNLEFVVTPTVRSEELIELSFKGQPSPASPPSQPTIGTDEVTARLLKDQALIVRGPDSTATYVEVSMMPVLGEIPLVGPMFFSSKKTGTLVNKSLLVITAKAADTPDNQETSQVPE